jgi:hypothetical protein
MPQTPDPAPSVAVESPPASPAPARDPVPDPRIALHRLAEQLVRAGNRRLLIEYLRLRRALK